MWLIISLCNIFFFFGFLVGKVTTKLENNG